MPIGFRIAFCFLLVAVTTQTHAQTIVSGDTPGEATVEQGAARYSIPIDVPEGLAGIAPDLTITYSSQSGDGPLGIGWSLSGLPIIHRCAQNKNPDGKNLSVNYTDTDQFCLNGQRLIPVDAITTNHGSDGKEYRTEMDQFSRITAHKAPASTINGPEYFTVEKADGSIETYGHRQTLGTQTYDSRIEAQGRSDQAVSVWALGKVTDRSGNKLLLHYFEDVATGEYRIEKIDYAFINTADVPHARVFFNYAATARLDNAASYHAGSKHSNPYLLERIDLQTKKTAATTWDDNRNYTLRYENSGSYQQSRLMQVQECVGTECLQPTVLTYRGNVEPVLPNLASSQLNTNHYSGKYRELLVLDYNGDGYGDLLLRAKVANGANSSNNCNSNTTNYHTYLATGGPNGLGAPVDVTSSYGMTQLAWAYKKVAQILDVNGDGLSDILVQGNHTTSTCSYEYGSNSKTRTIILPTDHSTYLLVSTGTGFTKITISAQNISNSDDIWSNEKRPITIFDHDGDGDSDILLQGYSYSHTYQYVCGENRHGSRSCWRTDNPRADTLLLSFDGISAFTSRNIHTFYGQSGNDWSKENHTVRVLDINGDGLQDLLLSGRENPTPNSAVGSVSNNQTYLLISTGAAEASDAFQNRVQLSGVTNWGGMSQDDWSDAGHGRHVTILDHNGDGLSDVLFQGTSTTADYLLTSTGTGFITKNISGSGLSQHAWGYNHRIARILDYNGDGRADVLMQGRVNNDTFLVAGSSDGFAYRQQMPENQFERSNRAITVLDANGDGMDDVLLQGGYGRPQTYVHYTTGLKNNLLATVIDGLGHSTRFDYQRLNEADSSYVKTLLSDGKINTLEAPMFIVASMYASNGLSGDLGGEFQRDYAYKDLRFDTQRRKFLGFRSETIRDHRNQMVTKTERYQDFPYVGMLKSKTVVTDAGQNVERFDNLVAHHRLRNNAVAVDGLSSYFAYTSESTKQVYELGDTTSYLSTTKKFTYSPEATSNEVYGELTKQEKIISSTAPLASATVTQDYKYQRLISPSVWCTQRVNDNTETYTASGAYFETDIITRKKTATWTTDNCLLQQDVTQADIGDNKKLTTDYQYTHGLLSNLSSIGARPSGVEPLDSTDPAVTYTASPVRSRSLTTTLTTHSGGPALLLTTTVSQGVIHSHIDKQYLSLSHGGLLESDSNGIKTVWAYDGFGRKIKESRADGSYTDYSYQQCNVVACGNNKPNHAVSRITAIDSVQGMAQIYQDKLGRTLREVREGFDGRLVFEDTEYNAQGRKSGNTRPYFGVLGDAAYWTRFDYDVFGRIEKIRKPKNGHPDPDTAGSGNYVDFNKSYQGLTSIEVNELAQTATRTKNLYTKLVQVIENDTDGGQLEYRYDGAGNLRMARVNGSAKEEITLTYDDLGRKIKMQDPSMGLWLYAYNSYGELTQQKDAKNQISNMHYDVLGRLIKRDNAGNVSEFQFDSAAAVGRLIKVTGPELKFEKTFSYETGTGLLLDQTLAFDENENGSIQGNEQYTHTWTYNNGQINDISYPTGLKLSRIYDNQGRFAAVYEQAKVIDPSVTALSLRATAGTLRTTATQQRSDAVIAKNDAIAAQAAAETADTNHKQAKLGADEQDNLVLLYRTDEVDARAQAETLRDTYATAIPIMVDDITSFFYKWSDQTQKTAYLALTTTASEKAGLANAAEALSITLRGQAAAYATENVNQQAIANNRLTDHHRLLKNARENEVVANADEHSALLVEDNQAHLSQRHWLATDRNAAEQLSGIELANELHSGRKYQAATGWLSELYAGQNINGDKTTQHNQFVYDDIGNLENRTDLINNIEQGFKYDAINRLTDANIVNQPALNKEYKYDPNGNITSFGAISNAYTYGEGTGANARLPYAVKTAGGLSLDYDDNGSLINDSDGRAITWTDFNKPRTLSKTTGAATSQISFDYDAMQMRLRQVAIEDTANPNNKEVTHYMGEGYEKVTTSTATSTATEHRHYLSLPGATIIVTNKTTTTENTWYTHYSLPDNLGSTSVVAGGSPPADITKDCATGQNHCKEGHRFGAFGERRNAKTAGPVANVGKDITNKGYTGHEMLESMGLVHMNGRLYDPNLGRFISADPFIQAPDDVQSFNRYSYVRNNPLGYTDPSGYEFGTNETRGYGMADFGGGDADKTATNSAPEVPVGADPNYSKTYYGPSYGEEAKTIGWDYGDYYGPSHGDEAESRGVSSTYANTYYGPSQGDELYGGQPDLKEKYEKEKDKRWRVYVVKGGRVFRHGWQIPENQSAGLGYRLSVEFETGGYDQYGHLDSDSLVVDVDDDVIRGQYLGDYADPTNGSSTGPHVHHERRDSSAAITSPGFDSPLGSGGRRTSTYGEIDSAHTTPHQGNDWAY